MEFSELAALRHSCRSYDETRGVEDEKLQYILETARLSPSACNGQPYHITVCRSEAAKAAAKCTVGPGGMNKFAVQAPVLLVISEMPYVATAAFGAKHKNNDYRSMDIGLMAAHLCFAAAEQGLGTCMLGWFDEEKIRAICNVKHPVRLVITLGYPGDKDKPREKKRKATEELVSFAE